MKKTPFDEFSNSEEELLAEYHFDYQKAKPNHFAASSGRRKITVVVLDEDVAQILQQRRLLTQHFGVSLVQ